MQDNTTIQIILYCTVKSKVEYKLVHCLQYHSLSSSGAFVSPTFFTFLTFNHVIEWLWHQACAEKFYLHKQKVRRLLNWNWIDLFVWLRLLPIICHFVRISYKYAPGSSTEHILATMIMHKIKTATDSLQVVTTQTERGCVNCPRRSILRYVRYVSLKMYVRTPTLNMCSLKVQQFLLPFRL